MTYNGYPIVLYFLWQQCCKESPQLLYFLLYCYILFIIMRLLSFLSGGATYDGEISVSPTSGIDTREAKVGRYRYNDMVDKPDTPRPSAKSLASLAGFCTCFVVFYMINISISGLKYISISIDVILIWYILWSFTAGAIIKLNAFLCLVVVDHTTNYKKM